MKKQSLIYPLTAVCMYLAPNLPCYAGEVFRNSVPEQDSIAYTLQGSMQADESLVGKDYNAIHQYMRRLGWDYSEHPNSCLLYTSHLLVYVVVMCIFMSVVSTTIMFT